MLEVNGVGGIVSIFIPSITPAPPDHQLYVQTAFECLRRGGIFPIRTSTPGSCRQVNAAMQSHAVTRPAAPWQRPGSTGVLNSVPRQAALWGTQFNTTRGVLNPVPGQACAEDSGLFWGTSGGPLWDILGISGPLRDLCGAWGPLGDLYPGAPWQRPGGTPAAPWHRPGNPWQRPGSTLAAP